MNADKRGLKTNRLIGVHPRSSSAEVFFRQPHLLCYISSLGGGQDASLHRCSLCWGPRFFKPNGGSWDLNPLPQFVGGSAPDSEIRHFESSPITAAITQQCQQLHPRNRPFLLTRRTTLKKDDYLHANSAASQENRRHAKLRNKPNPENEHLKPSHVLTPRSSLQ